MDNYTSVGLPRAASYEILGRSCFTLDVDARMLPRTRPLPVKWTPLPSQRSAVATTDIHVGIPGCRGGAKLPWTSAVVVVLPSMRRIGRRPRLASRPRCTNFRKLELPKIETVGPLRLYPWLTRSSRTLSRNCETTVSRAPRDAIFATAGQQRGETLARRQHLPACKRGTRSIWNS